MSIKAQIAEKMRLCGYDLLTAFEQAGQCIREFQASGQKQATYHIMGDGRVLHSFVLKRQTRRNLTDSP